MRIDRIHIDAFGLLRDRDFAPHPGLTLIRGDNETGKTTVLAFVRAMLFGFQKDHYVPPDGGRRGGWLELCTSDGRTFRIERRATAERGGGGQLRVLDREGRDGGAAVLSALLRQVDEIAYRNIFAFGLQQLARFESLSEGDVVARIYGAGLGTGAISALVVENALERERAAIFLPSGQKPSLNQLLAEAEATDSSIRSRNVPEEHREAVRRVGELDEAAQQVDDEIRMAEAEAHRLDRLRSAWQPWQDLRRVLAELEQTVEAAPLPLDARESLAKLETSCREAAEVLDRARGARRRAEQELAAAAVDEQLLAHHEEVQAVIQEAAEHHARRQRLQALLQERVARRSELDRELGRLGDGWDDQRMRGFDISIATRQTIVQSFAPRLASAHQEVRDRLNDVRGAEREIEGARAELGEIDQEIRQIEAQGAAISPPGAEPPGREQSGAGPPGAEERAHPQNAQERARQLTQLEGALQARALLADSAGIGERPGVVGPEAATTGPLGRLRMLLAGASAAAGLLAGLGLLAAGMPVLALVASTAGLGAAAAFLLVGGRFQAWLSARAPGPAAVRLQLLRLDQTIRAAAVALGLPEMPSTELLAETRRHIEIERQATARRLSLIERREATAGRMARLADRLAGYRQALAVATAAQESIRGEWRAWLLQHGLSLDLDPGIAAEIVGAVTEARRLLDSLESLDQSIERLVLGQQNFERSAMSLLTALDRKVSLADHLPAEIDRLKRDLEEALANARSRANAARILQERLAEEGEAEQRVGKSRAELEGFLAQYGSPSPAALRSLIESSERRRELQRQAAEQRSKLETLSGPGPAVERLLTDLQATEDIASIELERSHLDQRLRDLHDGRRRIWEDRRSHCDRIEAMETSAEVSTHRQALAEKLGMARAEAERWTALTLAALVLKRTRERYEREHQPAVVQIAERLFATWTGGRYRRIVAPLEGSALGIGSIGQVELAEGRLLPISALSTGTAEQLYLALRFGLVEHFAASAEPLPLIMDDVLVNFDPDRAARAARSIEELSARHQVLYFTCHPGTPLRPQHEVALALT
jgi:uncharacterized protein YhaN